LLNQHILNSKTCNKSCPIATFHLSNITSASARVSQSMSFKKEANIDGINLRF
jgi:hypothetical protein